MFMACQSYEEAKVTSKQELYDKLSVYAQWRVRKSKLVAKGGNDRNEPRITVVPLWRRNQDYNRMKTVTSRAR